MKKILIILFLITSFYSYSQKIKSIEAPETTLIYDTLGHPIQMITRHHEEINTVNYKNEYDEQNRLISSQTLIDSFPLLKKINKYEANKLVKIEYYQRTKFGTIHKYAVLEYNEKDSVSRQIVFSHKGDTLNTLSKSYNDENKLVREIEKDFEYKFLTQREFTYGTNIKTEKKFQTKMGSNDTIELKELKLVFNKNGDIIRREEWGLNGSLIFIDNKEISISKEEFRNGLKGYLIVSDFDYKYDKFNNWTQLDYYYKEKENKKNKTITKRLITYY